MAGESPDRSKQRESSAEPTSGSAGTVPEAREPRDPRVAAARNAEPSTPRGGVDTATRVFSVPDLKTESPEDPTAPEAADETGGPADTTPAGAPGKAAKATEAERSGEDEAEDEAEDAAGAAGTAEAGRTGGATEVAKPAETTKSDATGVDEQAEEAGEAETGGAGGKAEAADGANGVDGVQDENAAGASDTTEAEETDEAGAGGVEGASGGSGGAGAGSGGPEGGEEAVSAPERPVGASGGGDERLRTAVAQWVASADEKSPAEDEAVGPGAKERSESDTGAKPEAATKPVSKPAPKWASDADKAKSDEATSDDATSDEEVAPADKAVEADEVTDSPVDQPTAVFTAPRAKPAVDQPTTTLKLGGATKPKPDDADKADAEADTDADADADAEAPAERTSKFVALKPLDEPRPLKPAAPKASPEVTALVPQVGPERTTQQPLPPKPPLDLLAELTNTPPPPPTPLRMLGRRVKIWTPLLLLLVVIFAIAQAVRPLPATALTLTAKDSYTFDGGRTQLPWPGEGQGWMDIDGVGTMGSFGKQTPVAIGSVAKTMTAYIILKAHPMKAGEEGPNIEVDATAEKEGGYDKVGDESTLNTVKAGDQLTEKQALSAVLIPSANNIARLLARWDAGSEAAFVKKMNATARELGMTRTTYTDPSGLKETTVSTAEDQVKLGRAFVKVPALVAISSAASWTDPSGKYWNNYNELPYKMGAIGIKTGSTTAAGGNLLFASRKQVDGQSVTVVGAILGQHKRDILATVNAVSKTALLAAQDAITSAKILKKGDVVGYVDDKLGGHTPVVITKDVSAVGWAGKTVKLSFVADDVPHTAKAGSQVGTLTVGDGTGSAVKVPVALQTDLVEPGFTDKLTRIG